MFMIDGMKLGPDAVEFNYKRSKAELSRVSKLIRDIDQILLKVYSKHKQEASQEMQDKKVEENPVEQSPMIRKQLESEFIEIPVIRENKKKVNEAWTSADDAAKAHSDAYEKKHEKESARFRKEVETSKAKFLKRFGVKSNWDLRGKDAETYHKEWLPQYDNMWKRHIANMRKADAQDTNEAKKTPPKQIPDKNANKLGVRKCLQIS